MKSLQRLEESWLTQKQIFEEAQQRRVSHRNEEIRKLKEKIQKLQSRVLDLERANADEEGFPSQESFFRKAKEQSEQSKGSPRET